MSVSPRGFSSTAEEVAAGIDLSGRRVVVTGAASGIGIETARALAGTGADVTLAVRNTAAGERTAQYIATATGNHAVHVAALDLTEPVGKLAAVRGPRVDYAALRPYPQSRASPVGLVTAIFSGDRSLLGKCRPEDVDNSVGSHAVRTCRDRRDPVGAPVREPSSPLVRWMKRRKESLYAPICM
jgi:nucleoside-diphosphate-sugar epimerase